MAGEEELVVLLDNGCWEARRQKFGVRSSEFKVDKKNLVAGLVPGATKLDRAKAAPHGTEVFSINLSTILGGDNL